MQIHFTKLGQYGRLGNQLFQIAATLAIAKQYSSTPVFPKDLPIWQYLNIGSVETQHFASPPIASPPDAASPPNASPVQTHGRVSSPNPDPIETTPAPLTEPSFHFPGRLILDPHTDIDLHGYFQSEKWFEDCKAYIREQLSFKESFLQSLQYNPRGCTAVHVRRGDYVNNASYAQLDAEYYRRAFHYIATHGASVSIVTPYLKPLANDERSTMNDQLSQISHELSTMNYKPYFMVFSDDIPYCKQLFQGWPYNITYVEHQDEFQDLATMTLCQNFIIANSSFSWWGAWLGEKHNSTIIAPNTWFGPALLKTHSNKDIIPDRWLLAPLDPVSKIDLTDVTFTIPIKIDHPDRLENLSLCIAYLQKHFNTNISVMECDTKQKYFPPVETQHFASPPNNVSSSSLSYEFCKSATFHRTKMLNDMAARATTPIIANWDADIFINRDQILQAVNFIRNGAAGAYPYDGRFFRLPRENYEKLRSKLDTDVFRGMEFPKYQFEQESYGGAILWNKSSFFSGGGENENMIHFGPEDYERFERFTRLGYRIERATGPLFHLDHHTGANGSTGHAHLEKNRKEFDRIKALQTPDLREEIKTWPWAKIINTPKIRVNNPLKALNLDAIYCLNLERRPDRKAHAEKELSRIGFEDVTWWSARDGVAEGLGMPSLGLTPGMMGCYRSHEDMLDDAIAKGHECIMICEDDLIFHPGFNYASDLAMKQLDFDWDFLYFGYTEHKEFGTQHKKLEGKSMWATPISIWGTQCYIIKGLAKMQELRANLREVKFQIDIQLIHQALPQSSLKYFCVFPPLVGQLYSRLHTDVQPEAKLQA